MKRIQQSKNTTLRFRRWSRAAYAVFVSLSCAVTIGVLAFTVGEKSLHKSAGLCVLALNNEFEAGVLAEENVPDEVAEEKLAAVVVTPISSDLVAAGINNALNFLSTI
jgi:hypothetical protein